MFIAIERASLTGADWPLDRLPDEACISAIVLAELCVGVESARTADQAASAAAFVGLIERHFPLLPLPFSAPEARTWARLFAQLRRSGTTVGARDLQIAATALTHGHSVMTGNVAEFDRIPELQLVPSPFR